MDLQRGLQDRIQQCSAIVTAAVLIPRLTAAQFVSLSGNPHNILEGNWQSCEDPSTGRYNERVYDHVVNGVGMFAARLSHHGLAWTALGHARVAAIGPATAAALEVHGVRAEASAESS